MIKSIVLSAGLAIWALASASSASTLTFQDESAYENFAVFEVLPGGELKELPRLVNEFGFKFDLADRGIGEPINFSIRFKEPMEEGSVSIEVRNIEEMQVSLSILVTEELKRGYNIPVYYFRCIGACGFGEIDHVPSGITERHFERFFKAALMGEHYYLKLGTRNTPQSRRSVQLWRDASYYLGAHALNWWRMTSDIRSASKLSFGAESTRHQATEKYINEVNK